MRKILLTLFITSLYFNSALAQEGLFQFSKIYFRSNPFAGNFSGFLHHLLNDPSVLEKEIQKRTDTSFFYFSGFYKNYNPFFFKPGKVQVLLQEASVNYGDSLANDTIFIYQLVAYADGTEKGEQEVKREFEKIHRVFNKKFYNSNYEDLNNGESSGGVHNYFVAYSTLAPATTIWTKLNNEFVLKLVNKSSLDITKIECDLKGTYQQKNVKTIFATLDIIKNLGFAISMPIVLEALKQIKKLTGIFGRYEKVQTNPTILFDVSHNEAGIEMLFNQIKTEQYNNLHVVVGFVKDKEIDNVLNFFPKDATYYFTNAQIPRALPSVELKEKATQYSLIGNHFEKSNEAFNAAKSAATAEDLILVCGSFFIVSELM